MDDKLDYNPTTFKRSQINALCLLRQSKDIGGGWRQVSEVLWRLTDNMPDDLVEKDAEAHRVRFTERGKVIMDYLA